jgi:hypothetical protein
MGKKIVSQLSNLNPYKFPKEHQINDFECFYVIGYMLKTILLFTLSVLFISSCRKDSCNNVVKYTYDDIITTPHPYYPAYPGSFWVYNDSITVNVESTYKSFKLTETNTFKGCKSIINYEVLVPQIGEDYLYYDRLVKAYSEEHHSENILFSDDTLWKSWQDPESKFFKGKYYYGDMYYNHRKFVNRLDSITIGNTIYHDIMIIEESKYVSAFGGITLGIDTIYYAKNIGIVREMKMVKDNNPPFEVDTLDLTDYFINH